MKQMQSYLPVSCETECFGCSSPHLRTPVIPGHMKQLLTHILHVPKGEGPNKCIDQVIPKYNVNVQVSVWVFVHAHVQVPL